MRFAIIGTGFVADYYMTTLANHPGLDLAGVWDRDDARLALARVDTGIDPDHTEFGGRASVGFDVTGGDGLDRQGHGTHVAGTIGSESYGVAPGVDLVGVKVLDDSGSGSSAGIIEAMDWVAQQADGPSVANMSLGGSKDPALDNAASGLVDSGVFTSVAAGNESQDAANVSPASADGVFALPTDLPTVPDGRHDVTLTVRRAAQVWQRRFPLVLDRTAPVLAALERRTAGRTVLLTGELNEGPGAGHGRVELRIEGAGAPQVRSLPPGPFRVLLPAPAFPGELRLTVRDAAGNESDVTLP